MDEPGEEEEELAPLFDYSGVHGSRCLSDEELDDSPVVSNGSRKRKGGKEVVHILDDDEELGEEKKKNDEEEDWLPPPPKMRSMSSAVFEDNTLKALRSTKQELASLAEAKDLLNSGSEFGNTDVCILEKSTVEIKEDKCFEKVEREKIVLSIQDNKGVLQQFRLFVDDKFEKLFRIYAEKVNLKLENLSFSFDGERVSPAATPLGLGLENDDIIEVNVLPTSSDECKCLND